MLGVTTPDLAVIATALVLGALVQSLVGLGLGLVAAPIITLVEPSVMPELMLWLAFALPLVTLTGEREDIDWRGLGWAFPPRIVGTVGGVLAVTQMPVRVLGVLVGVMVLLAVVLTWRTVRIPLTRVSLMTAGVVSGFSGTATSIGGPPLAILYQHRPAREIRTTMAVYFVAGAGLSLGGLAVAGQVVARDVLLAASLLPTLVAGAAAGKALRPRLSAERVRPAVLVVCGTSASVLLLRSIVG